MAERRIGRTVAVLAVVTVGMFAFVFVVLVPMYDTLCQALGINGKGGGEYKAVSAQVDRQRTVKVFFVASRAENMPWEFQPETTEVDVHPGAVTNVAYFARNVTGHDMIAQAVPSFVPARAAQYFHKTECFCFQRQPLAAGKQENLALQFIVDQELPPDIRQITVSYTLFDVTNGFGRPAVAQAR